MTQKVETIRQAALCMSCQMQLKMNVTLRPGLKQQQQQQQWMERKIGCCQGCKPGMAAALHLRQHLDLVSLLLQNASMQQVSASQLANFCDNCNHTWEGLAQASDFSQLDPWDQVCNSTVLVFGDLGNGSCCCCSLHRMSQCCISDSSVMQGRRFRIAHVIALSKSARLKDPRALTLLGQASQKLLITQVLPMLCYKEIFHTGHQR